MSSVVVFAGCVELEVSPPAEALEELHAKAPPVVSLAGVWSGTGFAQPSSPVGADHDTHLAIQCGEATGSVTYTYAGPFECDSLLTLASSTGTKYAYLDDSQTAGCTDGLVGLVRGTGAHAGQLLFTWRYPDGTLDTQGWLTKIASANCPLVP